MDIRKVKKLIEMLEESKISEIEIHEGEESVRISRHSTMPGQPQTYVQVPMAGAPTGTETTPARPAGAGASTATGSEPEGLYIKSPMVGIFYASPAPDKAAFTGPGQQVKVGDVVCIIEAMKIMNQIEADIAGTVVKVLVDNGAPVEYGQPLFQISQS